MTSLNSLNGLSCGADNTGTTRVVYGSGGAVSIFCDAPQPPPEEGPPVFTGVTVGGNIATVAFNKPVCRVISWSAVTWEVTSNGVVAQYEDLGDSIPLCTAAADNGVSSASLVLLQAPAMGSLVAVTLTAFGRFDLRDQAGNVASGPQTRTATAGASETIPPTIVSATGAVGSTTLTIMFSEPVYCIAFTPTSEDVFITDNNPATLDPVAVGFGSNPCGATPLTAHPSFSIIFSSAFPGSTTYTVTLTPEPNEVQDVAGNDLANPSSTTFSTGAPDFTPPTITDARMVNNVASSDLGDVGDAFSATFSEMMNGTTVGSIQVQDQDGTIATLSCGLNVICTWNLATNVVTVTFVSSSAGSGGTTPGIQIPANITSLGGFTDTSGNTPNVLGSEDRLIDYE